MKRHLDTMTAVQLRKATREFDAELPVGPDGLPGRRLAAAERKNWKNVRSKSAAQTAAMEPNASWPAKAAKIQQ